MVKRRRKMIEREQTPVSRISDRTQYSIVMTSGKVFNVRRRRTKSCWSRNQADIGKEELNNCRRQHAGHMFHVVSYLLQVTGHYRSESEHLKTTLNWITTFWALRIMSLWVSSTSSLNFHIVVIFGSLCNYLGLDEEIRSKRSCNKTWTELLNCGQPHFNPDVYKKIVV